MQRKITVVVCVVLVVVAGVSLFLAVRDAGFVQAPLKIGVLLPLTGGLAIYGEPAQKVAVLAVEDINDAGGVGGRRIEAEFEDHRCDPKTAVSVFQELADVKRVKIFASVACSGTVLAIAPILESHGAFLVGTNVTTPKITGVSPYVFRNWATDATESRLFADEIGRRGYRTVGALYEETDYARGLVRSLEEFLGGSEARVASESFSPGATDVRTQLLKLQSQKPDAVFLSPQTVASGHVILRQMRELGFAPKMLFVNDNILRAPELLAAYGAVLEGAVSADYIIPQSAQGGAFLERYRARHGAECTQTNLCLAMYDAVRMLAEAMGKHGDDVEAVREYLEAVHYEGISGEVRFDEQHDRASASYSLFTIKKGKAVLGE
ncbi:MAG: ABC transporter substrate-binding protein [Candidatus Liptonbacteria bacterium]|nr:ABC transporter substrate-binding protein [Candidatus Liptonbacteria bacterium]